MYTFAPELGIDHILKIFTSKQELSGHLDNLKGQGKSIGFVPTMGALHMGHLSLIEIAKKLTDIVVCSIFVNPTQFNDPKDLELYPRPIEADTIKLREANCDILFLPSTGEMYAGTETWHIDLGYIETILEGKFRPGHYQGVTQIVKKLFDVVLPDKAFFGQKDFQQVKVISKMIEIYKMPVEIVTCPILRESDGLAMSSRNIHLSGTERIQALALSHTLQITRENAPFKTLNDLKALAEEYLTNSDGVDLEYFEICDTETLLPAKDTSTSLVALVAAKVGKTRLIDNIIIK
ncbi:pantoate--beta-alanine ligase [Desertivirga xinjiangensis]|uniref:pantoate--beta-alanine ligase n=1 Tax=Desertivirga xinjiangensis TaxID=539206 RepID=UPI00210C72D8|nr:pantoate--beta-alanine ligase [Pedobacter xinjiangensis]